MTNDRTRFVLTAGTTRTAAIDGISAAGADPEAMVHTPAADAGDSDVRNDGASTGGPPESNGVSHARRGDPGRARPGSGSRRRWSMGVGRTDRRAVGDGRRSARRRRAGTGPVSSAPGPSRLLGSSASRFLKKRSFSRRRFQGNDDRSGVLRALGERGAVSSSLPENPIETKRDVVGGAGRECYVGRAMRAASRSGRSAGWATRSSRWSPASPRSHRV